MNAISTADFVAVKATPKAADVAILGAGVLGVTTAYWLARTGLDVVVIERQPGAALETSFANGGQISVSHAEPWANPSAPLKVAKWLFDSKAPLLFRPRMDPNQWKWIAKFLGQCGTATSLANTKAIVELAAHSRGQLQRIRAHEGIDYDQRTQGILHFYRNEKEFEAALPIAKMMQDWGCERRIIGRDEVFAIEPTLAAHGHDIVGGTYTAADESGDVYKFTTELARIAEQRYGVTFLNETDVLGLDVKGGQVAGVRIRSRQAGSPEQFIAAKSVVVALGSYTAPFMRGYGVNLPIYPAKGYSLTLDVPEGGVAPTVSLTDDEYKLVYSRLGNRLRVAGSAELVGYDTEISKVRCDAIFDQVSKLFPEAGDLSTAEYWTGLRPATPNNLPILGRVKGAPANLFLNSGHGTLGWTMGAGSGLKVARDVADSLGADRAALSDMEQTVAVAA